MSSANIENNEPPSWQRRIGARWRILLPFLVIGAAIPIATISHYSGVTCSSLREPYRCSCLLVEAKQHGGQAWERARQTCEASGFKGALEKQAITLWNGWVLRQEDLKSSGFKDVLENKNITDLKIKAEVAIAKPLVGLKRLRDDSVIVPALHKGNLAKAWKVYQLARHQHPDDALLLDFGVSGDGDTELGSNPDAWTPRELELAANLFLLGRDWGAAGLWYDRLRQSDPNNARGYFGMGRAAHAMREFDRAIQNYNKAAMMGLKFSGLARLMANAKAKRKFVLREAIVPPP